MYYKYSIPRKYADPLKAIKERELMQVYAFFKKCSMNILEKNQLQKDPKHNKNNVFLMI